MLRSVLIIVFVVNISFISRITSIQRPHGPSGLEDNETTTCDDFSKFARFNPYSVLDSEWMVFYYWGPVQNVVFYTFLIPTENQVAYFKGRLEGHTKEAINWTAKHVLLKERNNFTALLVERSDRGEYSLYIPFGELRKNDILEPLDVRFKQTGDNRYLGFMICESHVVYIMSRVKDVPRKKEIQDAAARMGYRGRGGKSYLYQGHHWLPIPEADEQLFWSSSKMKRWYLYE